MPPVATPVQFVPPLVLTSQLIVPLPLPDNTTLPLVPLHTEVEVLEKVADAGAWNTVILTILLLTAVQTANASLTTARYHLSPTELVAVIEVVVNPKEVQVV